MKMVKSLLLGSAAGIVAVAGAQAADLPVKAKPVEYVKVCSLYGAGYYYMPGTDICLKLGGYVRWQISAGQGANITSGPHAATGSRNTRTDSMDTAQRTRALITVDTRQQTAYGTLRTYILLGYSQDSTLAETTSPNVYMTRGFIQIAGFTFGKATSFFDIVPGASFAYNAGMFYHPDTGDAGKMLAAYTAQFGNGVSGTIAIQQSNRRSIANLSTAGTYSFTSLGAPTNNSRGGLGISGSGVNGLPDIVGNIRIDQSWGTWLVAAAAHETSGGFYGATLDTGHPENKWGWAATTGFILNLPMLAPGDRLSAGFVYSEGAIAYASVTPSGATVAHFGNGTVGWGFWEDAIYAAGGSVQLTTAWSASAAFEHLWTPALKTSWYGSYVDVSHNAAATALICGPTPTGVLAASWGGPGCNPDFSSWNVGSRTQWEPVKGLIMGVDIIYAHLNSAQANAAGTLVLTSASGGRPAATYRVSDQSTWTGTFRIQRDFLP
jgi:hypothetical protein